MYEADGLTRQTFSRLAPQQWVGNLDSVVNSELSPRLSNFLSNIRAFEDHVNHWALSHVQI